MSKIERSIAPIYFPPGSVLFEVRSNNSEVFVTGPEDAFSISCVGQNLKTGFLMVTTEDGRLMCKQVPEKDVALLASIIREYGNPKRSITVNQELEMQTKVEAIFDKFLTLSIA